MSLYTNMEVQSGSEGKRGESMKPGALQEIAGCPSVPHCLHRRVSSLSASAIWLREESESYTVAQQRKIATNVHTYPVDHNNPH